jgi:hypothetical protein
MKVSLQAKANILKVVAIAIFVFIIYSVSGCSSCRSTKRYWRKHRCVEVQPKQQQLNYIHNSDIG